jgi:hypothetical protein
MGLRILSTLSTVLRRDHSTKFASSAKSRACADSGSESLGARV